MNRLDAMTDLQKIVAELCDQADLTEVEIATKLAELGIKTSQPTINRIKNGTVTRTSFEVGSALVQLHKKHVRPAARV